MVEFIPKAKSNNPLLIVMRHGERADFAKDVSCKYEIPFDPCLTTCGLKQTFHTGLFLNKYFDLSKRKIYIYSSPLLRTLQSASQVMRALGIEKTHKLQISNYLVEELYRSYFPINPLKGCLSKIKSHEYIKSEILNGIEFIEDTSTPELKFPENYDTASKRCAKCFEYFLEKHSSDENCAILLISHGRMLDEFSAFFTKNDSVNYEYCGISAVEIQEKGKFNVLCDDYTGHMKTKEYNTK